MKNPNPNDYRLWLLLIGCLCLVSCAGMSAAETTGAVVAGTGAAATFLADLFGIMKPFLTPEQVAVVGQKLASAQSWTEALTQVVGAIGEQVAAVSAKANAAQDQAAQSITIGQAGTIGAAGIAVDRVISAGQRAHRRAKAKTS